jgi:hypothetical protein
MNTDQKTSNQRVMFLLSHKEHNQLPLRKSNWEDNYTLVLYSFHFPQYPMFQGHM